MKKKNFGLYFILKFSKGTTASFICNGGIENKKIGTEKFPAAQQPGEILANAFGTCHCRTCDTQTKAMARAKPLSENSKFNWEKPLKAVIILLTSVLTFNSYSQTFNLRVRSYEQSCTQERVYCDTETQLNWRLTSTKSTLYYGTNWSAIESYTILKFEYDRQNDYYNYTFYDSKRDKYGIIVYFKPHGYLSMQYANQECSLDYFL